MRGKYKAWASAKDPYGNQAKLSNHSFHVGVGAPGLTVMLAGETGRPESPIHNASCPCRELAGGKRPRSEGLEFQWRIAYDYPEALDWTAELERSEGSQAIPCKPPAVKSKSGTARLLLDDLLPWLEPGENVVRWSVRDRDTKESGESKCTVVYGPAVTVRLSPEPGTLAAAVTGSAWIQVKVSGLPAEDVDRVLVNGSTAERHGDAWTCEVPIGLAGETHVKASVCFKGKKACEHFASAEYSLPPREGVAYVFDLPGIQGRIELLYCQPERFWYALPGFSARLQGAAGGKRSRVRWAEAQEAVQTLNEKLESVLGEGRFRLPRLQELKAIGKDEPGWETDAEWLDGDDPEAAGSAPPGDFAPWQGRAPGGEWRPSMPSRAPMSREFKRNTRSGWSSMTERARSSPEGR